MFAASNIRAAVGFATTALCNGVGQKVAKVWMPRILLLFSSQNRSFGCSDVSFLENCRTEE
eukprot:SAG31_NODE_21614_length_545_cov_1.015695_1_plen_60_part_01